MPTTRTLIGRIATATAWAWAAALAGAPEDAASASRLRPSPRQADALLPEAIASFGAAVSGNWLYVYGGHTGRAHEHSRDNVSPAFRRLNLLERRSWEELPSGPELQGAALAAHGGSIYRVGGLSALNARGEPEDLRSVASAARFDPLARRWHDLPPLPSPRSSHDAVVLGDRLVVAGGWDLQGGEKRWHTAVHAIDLKAAEPKWELLAEAPFQVRALAASTTAGKLVVIGGMTPDRGTTRSVHVYDPALGRWSAGAEYPGEGFGVAAASVDGVLHASGMDGKLYRLAADASRWEAAGELCFPRFFHRLAPSQAGELLAVGGAATGAHLRSIEPLALGPAAPGSNAGAMSWLLPFPGKAKNRQGAFLAGNDLYLFGGNSSLKQHDFGPENFLSQAYRVHLGELIVHPIEELPAKRQSMGTLVVNAEARPAHSRGPAAIGFAIGGFAHDGEAARSHGEVFRFDVASRSWEPIAPGLPAPRTQFGAVEHDGQLWVFGGWDFDPRRASERQRFPREVLRLSIEPPASFTSTPHTLPRPRRAFGGARLGGKYYLVGGLDEDFEPVEECDVFDFASGSWETMPAPRRPRISPELAALNGKLYLAGGSAAEAGGSFNPGAALECYDPETRLWSVVLESLPAPLEHPRMLPFRSRLLFFSTHHSGADALRLLILDPKCFRS